MKKKENLYRIDWLNHKPKSNIKLICPNCSNNMTLYYHKIYNKALDDVKKMIKKQIEYYKAHLTDLKNSKSTTDKLNSWINEDYTILDNIEKLGSEK